MWATKKHCSAPNHDDQERVALSNSGKRPAGTAAARESEDSSENFPTSPLLCFERIELAVGEAIYELSNGSPGKNQNNQRKTAASWP